MTGLDHLQPGEHRRVLLPGPAGDLEVLVDAPPAAPRGLVLVGHPQPLLGGSATHKIPQLLARELQSRGWLVLRPNFRGVGGSAGQHDHGQGEAQDLLWLCEAVRARVPALALALVGFSFGGHVMGHVAAVLAQRGRAAARVAILGAPVGLVPAGRHYEPAPPAPGALYIHGEHDERVALQPVLDWCGQHGQALLVVPGVDHFFKGRLPLLRDLVANHLEPALG